MDGRRLETILPPGILTRRTCGRSCCWSIRYAAVVIFFSFLFSLNRQYKAEMCLYQMCIYIYIVFNCILDKFYVMVLNWKTEELNTSLILGNIKWNEMFASVLGWCSPKLLICFTGLVWFLLETRRGCFSFCPFHYFW